MRLHWVPILAMLSSCQSLGPAVNPGQSSDPQPVPSVLDTPVEFVGPRGNSVPGSALNEIRIGLFAPTSADFPVGLSMFRGANLAIEQFNAAGGRAGVPISLRQRWDDDPWRGGSKEMIKLVYEDSVWAVIGSVNGEATHVAEQVVTKAWLPLLSPVSADPTLTYIRIPWMFRLPPDDKKQAAVLVRDGIEAHSLTRVGLITSTDHDGRIFAEEMSEQMSAAHAAPIFHFRVSLPSPDLNATKQRASSFGPDGIVVRLPIDEVLRLLDSFETGGLRIPVLLPWIPGLMPADLTGRYSGEILYVSPFSQNGNPAYSEFAREYQERYGAPPTPCAAYAFDAVNVLIQSLRANPTDGLNRADLRDTVADASGYVGATGVLLWDNAGGNRTEPVLHVLAGSGSRN